MIPAQAVEAAIRTMPEYTPEDEADSFDRETNDMCRAKVELILEAAAPYMLATSKPKPGEGDYAPSWDDRKRLAEAWQGKAPLPAEGLSEHVYEALIEVAAWGYQQRADEDL